MVFRFAYARLEHKKLSYSIERILENRSRITGRTVHEITCPDSHITFPRLWTCGGFGCGKASVCDTLLHCVSHCTIYSLLIRSES